MKHAIINLFKNYKEGDIIKINPAEIQKIPELQNVFKIDLDVKERIKDDMRINGFSKSHPIHVFKWKIDGKEILALCDGYTRYTAATELGLDKIFAQIHSFNSINEAVLYSMKEQFNRRNIQDSELFRNFEILRQQEIDGHKITAEEMCSRLNKSRRHIFKLQEVFSKSTKEQLSAIRNGLSSINQVYNEIKKKERAQSESINSYESSSTETEQESSNTIQPEDVEVNLFSCPPEQDNQITSKKDSNTRQQKLQSNSVKANQKETSFSKQLSDKQILLLGAKYALIQIAKGKSAAEILNANSFGDSIKATDITFDDKEIALLETM